MANITRIKASDTPAPKSAPEKSRMGDEPEQPPITRKKVVVKDKKQEKIKNKATRKAEKAEKRANREAENNGKKPFILIRPFVYLGRYIRGAWRELRQVRWPNRKTTWKMVLAVLVYTALFVVIITLLDMFFSWLFSLFIK
ncbi:preprotein translocase subunit SecE [Candidatus Saccharibacteria bacterium]|nr:preprotein translocase subunit SecE [Candidatus Saccharibacteria bacterium]